MYIQPLVEYKANYHDVTWYATVTWRARRATDGITNRKQKEKRERAVREKMRRIHTKVRHPLHFTSVTPTWNSLSVFDRFGLGSCRWGGFGMAIMTAIWRLVFAGGCLKNNRCSGFSKGIGRMTWPWTYCWGTRTGEEG